MARSPFSSAGGGNADGSPYSEARSKGGRTCRANGGSVKSGGDIKESLTAREVKITGKGPDKKQSATAGEIGRKNGGKANWIAGAIGKPGALHKATGTPKGQKIPTAKLEKAENSKSPKVRKEANLAETLKGFKK